MRKKFQRKSLDFGRTVDFFDAGRHAFFCAVFFFGVPSFYLFFCPRGSGGCGEWVSGKMHVFPARAKL